MTRLTASRSLKRTKHSHQQILPNFQEFCARSYVSKSDSVYHGEPSERSLVTVERLARDEASGRDVDIQMPLQLPSTLSTFHEKEGPCFRLFEHVYQKVVDKLRLESIESTEELRTKCLGIFEIRSWGESHLQSNPGAKGNHSNAERHRRRVHHVLCKTAYETMPAYIHQVVDEILSEVLDDLPDFFPEEFVNIDLRALKSRNRQGGRVAARCGKNELFLGNLVLRIVQMIGLAASEASNRALEISNRQLKARLHAAKQLLRETEKRHMAEQEEHSLRYSTLERLCQRTAKLHVGDIHVKHEAHDESSNNYAKFSRSRFSDTGLLTPTNSPIEGHRSLASDDRSYGLTQSDQAATITVSSSKRRRRDSSYSVTCALVDQPHLSPVQVLHDC